MGRHKIRTNTDEQAEIETMGVGCKRKRCFCAWEKKDERWRDRQIERAKARWREWKERDVRGNVW